MSAVVNPLDIPVRFSLLKAMGKSAAHYRYRLDHDLPQGPALRIGRAGHLRCLGAWPDGEDGESIVYEGSRRGKAWAAFRDEHPDADILTRAEWDVAGRIADAVAACEVASPFLRDATKERHIAWEMAGRACSSRPDAVGTWPDDIGGGTYLVDLKTCRDASPRGFMRQAVSMGYHAQMDFYAEAIRHQTGARPRDVYLIAVEVTAPHVVTTFRLEADALELGARTWRAWWETLRSCEQASHWPGYATSVVPFPAPAWAGLDLDMGGDDEGEAERPEMPSDEESAA